jgi:8-oxo-dGTP diphosphatase
MLRPIRNSAKAIIIEGDRLLAMKGKDPSGTYYLLPGGGQEPGETLVEALRRECREEVNAELIVGELRFIREYIGRNHEFAESEADVHQVEFMFVCRLADGCQVGVGPRPDVAQCGVEWLELSDIERYRLYPRALGPRLKSLAPGGPTVYLGDVN